MELSLRQRSTTSLALEKVVVAVRAERVISKTGLAWALTHVVRPGDCVTLLALFLGEKKVRRFWNFPMLAGDCGSSIQEELPERICQISESCSQMVLQFHNQIEVTVRIKVVSGTTGNAVAAEAKNNGANWVILDKKLKQELKHCLDELHCNIVVMKGSQAKVLRLNLQCINELQTPYFSAAASPVVDAGEFLGHRMKHSTPVGSPEEPGTSYSRTSQERLLPSSDSATSLFLVYQQNPLFEGLNRGNYTSIDDENNLDNQLTVLNSYGEELINLSANPASSGKSNDKSIFWIPQNHIEEKPHKTKSNRTKIISPTSKTLLGKFVQYDQVTKAGRHVHQSQRTDYMVSSNIRDAVALGRTSSVPPPLCSFCQHQAPVFGKPPRRFSYEELEEATNGFSELNFLAEGGFGVVYRGILRDGQVVAVKLLKFVGCQADIDFCREVQVLSCAQHRNVVLLIGFCIDGNKRVLVYEYICNGSLDFHLHGSNKTSLDWQSRLRIAVGAARGLRYLHEDCRVGCIVHRDMRPKNILLTHDFEPQVTDFGLARWHSDQWIVGSEERAIGTSGYLAPEYLDGGRITQKVDVYAFGVVLLELMTGQRISDLQFYKGQNFLSEWFHPLAALDSNQIMANIYQLLDPCLASSKVQDYTHQLQAMGRAAFLCLSPDPESRPSMSKVLRMLEGGDVSIPLSLDLNSIGNRSGHLRGLKTQTQPESRRRHSRRLSH
ncbi:PREDICTED: inactive protein kinase SELMODRAFT_444075 isoform X2 [Theobroma cacao]|uniref:non-specific serine/threonine protein kinase n=1 Tax=Theobroma cacao TaxID=3641 RepID=A0AB32WRZ2_THECC|nr:PREDICTED: inactive protein kinase SELMODRAFT_444075 isoform X2 [Theobroma cacao]